jgi:hypothetical protein
VENITLLCDKEDIPIYKKFQKIRWKENFDVHKVHENNAKNKINTGQEAPVPELRSVRGKVRPGFNSQQPDQKPRHSMEWRGFNIDY